MLSAARAFCEHSYRAVQRYRAGDPIGAQTSLYNIYIGLLEKWERYNHSRTLLDKEWDVAIVLDACRVDALRYCASEYDWLTDIEATISVAGRTPEWMDMTFETPAACSAIHYVSGNPYSVSHLRDAWFAKMLHLSEREWSDEYHTVPAKPVTDAAIRTWRSADDGSMIVHYMQPHFPSVPSLRGDVSAKSFGRGGIDGRWESVRRDEITKIDVIESYLANLRYVLDEVEILLHNLDAEDVLITADHGTCLGEYGIYGHAGYHLPKVFSIPLARTTATDERTREPTVPSTETDHSVEDQLAALGYVR